MYLNHITLTTGHLARTSRGDLAARVRRLVREGAEWHQRNP